MTRIGLCAIGVGALVLARLVTAAPALAGDKPKCSLATLKGQYMVSAQGMLFPPAFGVSKPSVSEAGGFSIYNGDGTGTDYVTFTVDGVNVNVASPTPMTYTLNSDCTGTRSVQPSGPDFNIYAASDGSSVTEIGTDQGLAVSDTAARVGKGH
jgi:hypothetical protein